MIWSSLLWVVFWCVLVNVAIWLVQKRIEKRKRVREKPREINFNVGIYNLRDHMEVSEGCFSYPDSGVTLRDCAQAMAAAYFSYCEAREPTGIIVEVLGEGRVFLVMPSGTPDVALNELRTVMERIKPIHISVEVSSGDTQIRTLV